MGRLLIGGLIVAIIAALLFYFYSSGYRTQIDQQTQQVSQLNDQLLNRPVEMCTQRRSKPAGPAQKKSRPSEVELDGLRCQVDQRTGIEVD